MLETAGGVPLYAKFDTYVPIFLDTRRGVDYVSSIVQSNMEDYHLKLANESIELLWEVHGIYVRCLVIHGCASALR